MESFTVCSILIVAIFVDLLSVSVSGTSLYLYSSDELITVLEDSCFIGVNERADKEIHQTFLQLRTVYANERHVHVGRINIEQFVWPNGQHLKIDGLECKSYKPDNTLQCSGGLPDIIFFAKITLDRSCLLNPAHALFQPHAVVVTGANTLDTLVSYVNNKCHAFRHPDGSLLPAGHHRQYILDNVFQVASVSNVTMEMLYQKGECLHLDFTQGFLSRGCKYDVCERDDGVSMKSSEEDTSKEQHLEIPQCKVIDFADINPDEFFHDYIKLSHPVVIKNGVLNWPAWHKWSRGYLSEKYGNKTVHIKLTPGGDFEGVERATLWEDYSHFVIPEMVRKKLPYPDLVVVRPAGVNMKFSEFLDLITWAAEQTVRNVSAYLEYSSIREYMPELLNDIEEFTFVKDKLSLRHLNMWLSDGNTVGRLHFDPFDNFLCQLRGKKQLLLFEPFNNSRLYEGHIPQATLSYNHSSHSFKRKTLEDSTSMVMSPVDLFKPDLKRFPYFKEAQPLNCTIDEGDVLYMPSFWWHEVYSYPNIEEKRNLAVNFWYEPFLVKEFPCPECKMDINPYYYHLLY